MAPSDVEAEGTLEGVGAAGHRVVAATWSLPKAEIGRRHLAEIVDQWLTAGKQGGLPQMVLVL